MKNLLVVFLAFIFTASLFAQSPIGKGTYTLGGSISYSFQTFDDSGSDQTVFKFNPEAGYFFIDNFYVALSFTYAHYSYGNSKSDQYGIGPTARYYFDADQLKPFLGVGYNYYRLTFGSSSNKISSSELKLIGGVDYFITENFALEANMNYSFINYNYPDGYYYYSYVRKSKMFQVGVGVNYFIY
ncbi:MAG: outer membrane beta-barrel protein [Ignavibacteriales bacterium]|nr:outer membrane beta-barrel protein [Ignavibacteriales bacterium]